MADTKAKSLIDFAASSTRLARTTASRGTGRVLAGKLCGRQARSAKPLDMNIVKHLLYNVECPQPAIPSLKPEVGTPRCGVPAPFRRGTRGQLRACLSARCTRAGTS